MRIGVFVCVVFSMQLKEKWFVEFAHFQVDLEPQGKIHVIIELKWHGKSDDVTTVTDTIWANAINFPDQSNVQSGSVAPAKAASGAEFKERAAFNRRRGAMRRRVHQVHASSLIRRFASRINPLTGTYFRWTDTSLWPHFCVSRHSVHTAVNSFGKQLFSCRSPPYSALPISMFAESVSIEFGLVKNVVQMKSLKVVLMICIVVDIAHDRFNLSIQKQMQTNVSKN